MQCLHIGVLTPFPKSGRTGTRCTRAVPANQNDSPLLAIFVSCSWCWRRWRHCPNSPSYWPLLPTIWRAFARTSLWVSSQNCRPTSLLAGSADQQVFGQAPPTDEPLSGPQQPTSLHAGPADWRAFGKAPWVTTFHKLRSRSLLVTAQDTRHWGSSPSWITTLDRTHWDPRSSRSWLLGGQAWVGPSQWLAGSWGVFWKRWI